MSGVRNEIINKYFPCLWRCFSKSSANGTVSRLTTLKARLFVTLFLAASR
jgi:hypothetical protein